MKALRLGSESVLRERGFVANGRAGKSIYGACLLVVNRFTIRYGCRRNPTVIFAIWYLSAIELDRGTSYYLNMSKDMKFLLGTVMVVVLAIVCLDAKVKADSARWIEENRVSIEANHVEKSCEFLRGCVELSK